MKREHEARMFVAATLSVIKNRAYAYPEYIETYYDELIADETLTVLSPKGSKFKNCACIITTHTGNLRTPALLREYNPDSISNVRGIFVFVFEEGQHVMEATGAAAALRKQEEG